MRYGLTCRAREPVRHVHRVLLVLHGDEPAGEGEQLR